MTRSWIALVAAFALTLSGAARAQETFESLAGTWWFKIGGKDRGALFIAFTEPHVGLFETDDTLTLRPSFGFSSTLGSFFEVAPGQPLSFDSKGNTVGTLELTDPDTDELVGTLILEKGKPNKKFTGWRLRALVEGDDGIPVIAKLVGKRVPDTFPVLSGSGPATTLSGKGVKSKVFDTHVVSDTELGLPAYAFAGAGPVLIDKVETPDTTMAGRFMLSPKFELFGLLEESSAFGEGGVSGKLKLPVDSLIPKLKLVARADRKVTATGKLTEPVEPILSVTPTSFDFGAVHLNDPNSPETVFTVANIGVGVLEGEAHFLDGSSSAFSFLGDASYSIDADDPNEPVVPIVVEFAPTTPGEKTARILFDVSGGAGARIVTLTGVGGIAELTVDPESISFDDTAVGAEVFETVTISNTGDGVLEGRATVTGADFALALLGSNNTVPLIDYELDPGEERSFSVRFKPGSAGDKTGSLVLTGGGGASVPLSGSTP